MMANTTIKFKWNKMYYFIFSFLFLVFLSDTFLQIHFKNVALFILSLVFSILFLAMLIMVFKIPFAEISNRRIKVHLTPIISKSIMLNDIDNLHVDKKKVTINLVNGDKVFIYLSMAEHSERERFVDSIQNICASIKGKS